MAARAAQAANSARRPLPQNIGGVKAAKSNATTAKSKPSIRKSSATKTIRRCKRALMRLPEKYRTPIVLKYFEYLSLDEIAAILGRPVGTVKSLVHRGIAKLREDQGLREARAISSSRQLE
jgi:RNA polymerase sigma factor (sigma-70 family)